MVSVTKEAEDKLLFLGGTIGYTVREGDEGKNK